MLVLKTRPIVACAANLVVSGGGMCVPVPLQIFYNWGLLRPHKVETAFCSHCGMSKPIHSSFKSTVIFRTKTYDYKILLAATCNESFMLFIPCMLPYFEKFPGILNHRPQHYWKIRKEHALESKRW